jgi:hypothetical protein
MAWLLVAVPGLWSGRSRLCRAQRPLGRLLVAVLCHNFPQTTFTSRARVERGQLGHDVVHGGPG